MVSSCDIGLIPYNQKGFYYNICYPTKASFYITAGIPFISTQLAELKNEFLNQKVCIFADFTDWSLVLKNLSNEEIQQLKENVNKISSHYTWENLIENNKYINMY